MVDEKSFNFEKLNPSEDVNEGRVLWYHRVGKKEFCSLGLKFKFLIKGEGEKNTEFQLDGLIGVPSLPESIHELKFCASEILRFKYPNKQMMFDSSHWRISILKGSYGIEAKVKDIPVITDDDIIGEPSSSIDGISLTGEQFYKYRKHEQYIKVLLSYLDWLDVMDLRLSMQANDKLKKMIATKLEFLQKIRRDDLYFDRFSHIDKQYHELARNFLVSLDTQIRYSFYKSADMTVWGIPSPVLRDLRRYRNSLVHPEMTEKGKQYKWEIKWDELKEQCEVFEFFQKGQKIVITQKILRVIMSLLIDEGERFQRHSLPKDLW